MGQRFRIQYWNENSPSVGKEEASLEFLKRTVLVVCAVDIVTVGKSFNTLAPFSAAFQFFDGILACG